MTMALKCSRCGCDWNARNRNCLCCRKGHKGWELWESLFFVLVLLCVFVFYMVWLRIP